MLDDHIARFRDETESNWDDLRERRVLRGARQRLQETRESAFRRRRLITLGAPGLAAVAALFLAYFAGAKLGLRPAKPESLALEAPAAVPAVSPALPPSDAPVRMLSDGSRLELSPAAHVEVRGETPARIHVAQTEGRVRYDIAHVPSREFLVEARGAEVRVRGTVFVVDVGVDRVRVSVERGRVQVHGSVGELELGAGEELVLAPNAPPAPEEASAPPATPKAPVAAARPAAPVETPQATAFWERADRERALGNGPAAAATLHEFIQRFPGEPRIPLAWFTLGKVERARGQASLAARAFHASFSAAPSGPLAQDALAEEAAAWDQLSDAASARAAAERYLQRFPNGAHAGRMHRILE
jgi:transmembrane sensor